MLLLTLWLNFRRSWYFPWNKNRRCNNPARWSIFSLREKPRLPLGRNLVIDEFSELGIRYDGTHDGSSSAHGHGTSDGHGYGSVDSHFQLLRADPIPEIHIKSPKSAVLSNAATLHRWSFSRSFPPGLENYSRWSATTTHISVGTLSIYSDHPLSFLENEKATDKYTSGERDRPETATSVSSDNNPFRFDIMQPVDSRYNLLASRNPAWSGGTSSLDPPSISFPHGRQREARTRYIGHVMDAPKNNYNLSTRGSSILQEFDNEGSADQPTFGLSAIRVDREHTGPRNSGPMRDFSPVGLISSSSLPRSVPLYSASPHTPSNGPGSTPQRTPPKSILKSPHYLTTSARMAGRRRNVI